MTAPPSKTSIAGTPSNAEAKAGFSALWDYVVGLLGGDATAPAPSDAEKTAARTALGAMSSADGSVTYAKIQNVSAGKVLGRDTSGSGVVQELPLQFDAAGNAALGGPPSSWAGSYKVYETSAGFFGSDGSNYLFLGSNCYAGSGGFKYKNSAAVTLFEAGIDGYKWRVASSGSAGSSISFVQSMALGLNGQQKTLTADGGALMDAYACRAFVNFNGTGAVAIRAGGNVSSITDNGVGDYTINFTTAMPHANYCAVMSCGDDNAGNSGLRVANALNNAARSVSSIRVGVSVVSSSSDRNSADDSSVSVSIFC